MWCSLRNQQPKNIWIILLAVLCLYAHSRALALDVICLRDQVLELTRIGLPLPRKITVEINRIRSKQLFDIAARDFREQFHDRAELDSIIARLMKDGDVTALSPAEKLRLKELRRAASLLRSSFVTFGDSHRSPRKLNDFVTEFGKLNDRIDLNPDPAQLRKQAKTLSETLDYAGFENAIEGFTPAPRKSVMEFFDSQFKEIEKILEDRKVAADDYHTIRTNLKNLLTISQLINKQESNPIHQQTADYLLQQDELLGVVQDRIAQEQLQQPKQHIPKLSLPKEAKKKLLSLLDRIRFKKASARNERLLLANHLRQSASGEWEALLPGKKGFKIKTFASREKALEAARSIEEPLDLEALILREKRIEARVLPVLEEAQKALGGESRGFLIKSRIKSQDSLRNKIFKKVQENGASFHVEEINDILGTKLVVPDSIQLERAVRELQKSFDGELVKTLSRASETGYRATHLIGETPTGERFEIQVLTRRMWEWDKYSHDRAYKPNSGNSADYQQRLGTYSVEVGRYVQALDDGSNPPAPNPDRYGLKPEDHFPLESIR